MYTKYHVQCMILLHYVSETWTNCSATYLHGVSIGFLSPVECMEAHLTSPSKSIKASVIREVFGHGRLRS
jgi:hypothetical protein